MIVKGEVSSAAVATVYDINGKLIVSKKMDAGLRNSIRLPMVRSGVYMVFVKDNGKTEGFKVMVKE